MADWIGPTIAASVVTFLILGATAVYKQDTIKRVVNRSTPAPAPASASASDSDDEAQGKGKGRRSRRRSRSRRSRGRSKM